MYRDGVRQYLLGAAAARRRASRRYGAHGPTEYNQRFAFVRVETTCANRLKSRLPGACAKPGFSRPIL